MLFMIVTNVSQLKIDDFYEIADKLSDMTIK